MAPRGALDQLGQALSRIIHAFAKADDNTKIFMAKWDIKDGFWRMDCEEEEEYNFAYVLPQEEGFPITLVVPTSLQMGWVESPPYFCAATETARDIASDYCDTPVGSLPHLQSMLRGPRNSTSSRPPRKMGNYFMPSKFMSMTS